MKLYYSLVFFILFTNGNFLQISRIFFLQIGLVFYEKSQKPLIGFEPMTYALPWRYSTTLS